MGAPEVLIWYRIVHEYPKCFLKLRRSEPMKKISKLHERQENGANGSPRRNLCREEIEENHHGSG
jgi:hypothetical protein